MKRRWLQYGTDLSQKRTFVIPQHAHDDERELTPLYSEVAEKIKELQTKIA